MDYIICCDCRSVPKYARNAASIILKPKRIKIPKVTPQQDIHQLLWNMNKNSEGYRLFEKLMKRKGKFAFFISLDGGGKILETIDLLKGAGDAA